MQDGLLISEYYFTETYLSRLGVSGLMQEALDVLPKFNKEGNIVESLIYTDSRLLQSGNTIFDEVMKSSTLFELSE